MQTEDLYDLVLNNVLIHTINYGAPGIVSEKQIDIISYFGNLSNEHDDWAHKFGSDSIFDGEPIRQIPFLALRSSWWS